MKHWQNHKDNISWYVKFQICLKNKLIWDTEWRSDIYPSVKDIFGIIEIILGWFKNTELLKDLLESMNRVTFIITAHEQAQ